MRAVKRICKGTAEKHANSNPIGSRRGDQLVAPARWGAGMEVSRLPAPLPLRSVILRSLYSFASLV
jgi:hypothetical protein